MSTLIPVLILSIPILAIVLRSLRRWQVLDVEAARREVELRRRFSRLDEVDRRVADIERYVTSPEFTLNREIGALADRR
ncbi:MAG TPA: hypothetical protein VEB20_21875 [Azospirillaceae bacterium]|nr:hypothetical protein [Azospirillaceae bacterium]